MTGAASLIMRFADPSERAWIRRQMFSGLAAWEYVVDRDATIRAYSEVVRGGADTCRCSGCRNFRLARTQAFPPQFFGLLDHLGIDPFKDGEVFHTGRMAPNRHVYGGWYHFIGSLQKCDAAVSIGDNFQVYMLNGTAPRLYSLTGHAVVQLEFQAEAVPWLLNEPEPL